jgi:hypothetical protein
MILDKIEKLKEQLLSYRGEIDESTEKSIKIWQDQIRENQVLVDVYGAPGMKVLVKEVKRQLALVDNTLINGAEDRERDMLIAFKKNWTEILQMLVGAPERLRALEDQIDYELE